MSRHRLQTDLDEPFTGELTAGLHPDGTIEFENDKATVEDEDLARQLANRHTHVEYAGAVDDDSDESVADDSSADEAGEADDSDAETVAEPPLNPSEFSVDELEDALADGDYTVRELEVIGDAEEADKNRTTALDAIDGAIADVRE